MLSTSISVGFSTLKSNPLRTLLSTLGIIMGVASLVSVLSLGDGVEQYARSQIENTTDLQSISVGTLQNRMVDGRRFPLDNPVRLGIADLDSLRSIAGDGALVTIMVRGSALVTTRDDTTLRAAELMGATPTVQPLLDIALASGRFFTDDEVLRGEQVAVISASLAADLSPDSAVAGAIGSEILLYDSPVRVIGIIAASAGSEQPRGVVVPFGLVARVLPPRADASPPSVLIKMPGVEQVAPTRQRIESWAAARYGPTWKERVVVGTNRGRVAQAQEGILIFKLLMGALTGIALLVGGIGIMNVLLASVVERTREIGIRRAAGAERRHIMVQFLAESVAISSAGSLLGLALGIAAAYAVTALMRHLTSAVVYAGFSLSTVLVAVIASVTVGLTFGIYPALRAARLSPIDAIRHE